MLPQLGLETVEQILLEVIDCLNLRLAVFRVNIVKQLHYLLPLLCLGESVNERVEELAIEFNLTL